ncbi:putative disease resistance protein RGA4 isoform X1 [Triticum urartu]|uniref:putative disease resistance protein RGA4 isoform X1 n=1 Tax=Triticum urartu TaxID=4572 RepID=UPI0020447349|nr:putative disease resistance protein RGA4 isoform X1 [Triticum urartu]XP_048571056.1 putative disease resistance protein RGA4 isoform X1 [Triticum urartu]XP_048571058.1 putative disease resistance protein RGA4 isoform X1 [Triticum urartu]
MDPLSIAAIGWGLTATGWFVSPYITKLLDKAYAHIKPGKAKKKIRHLVNHTVPRLKLILEAAEGSEHKELFEELLADLRSAFYATEDILDEVEYCVRQHQSGRKRKLDSSAEDGPSSKVPFLATFYKGTSISSCLTIPGPLTRLLKENVARIEEIIEEAHKTIVSLNLQSNSGRDKYIPNAAAKSLQGSTLSVPTGKVTGRDEALKVITDMLHWTEDNTCLSVIGIIGIPGSGKTTLAQYVCKSETNGSHFDLVMWIHVSEYFTVQTLYREMFEQAWEKFGEKDKKCPQYDGHDMLRAELEKLLERKRFFLVLDDIWFNKELAIEDKLEQLLIPLKAGSEGSKILMTSRQDSLSRLGPSIKSTKYQIPDLDDDVFLKLFMHYALGNKVVHKAYQGKLQNIGAQIAEKLKKSPLLARVVGGTLFQKPTVEVRDWISVRDQNLLDKHMGALWWSYKHLAEQVRRCFAYCSIFPRRHPLRRDELINLWVAEGFINTTDGGQDAEDVGRGYFDELVSTSFLLPGGENYFGEYFVIHDLLHDLAVKVAGSDYLKIENEWTGNISPDVRHLYIQRCNASMITGHIIKLEKLRSLIVYEIDYDISKQVLGEMFSKLSKLRVLIFTARSSHQSQLIFPESIGSLKHLRYLGIRRFANNVTMPSTFSKLYLMQVLDLGNAWKVDASFGENIIKLPDLRHVISSYVCFPNIGRLTSLRTIPTFDVEFGIGYELHQLKHLNKLQGKLIITGLQCIQRKQEAIEAKLADKEQLTELELRWYEKDIYIEEVRQEVATDVFESLCPPENIIRLRVHGYTSPRYPNWMMGTQKSTMHLHKLELDSCIQPVCGPGLFFIPVSSLVMMSCYWDNLPHNMDGVESLQIMNSPISSNMQHLTSLKGLILRYENDPYYVTLPTLPNSLEYIEIIGWNWIASNKIWEKIKDVPNKVIDGLTVDDVEDFPWTDDSSDEGSEATGSYERAGGSSLPEGSSGGSSAEEDSGATDMV